MQWSITKVESANEAIFNYVRVRLIEGNEIIYKKDLLDAYNNSLSLEREAVRVVKPIQKILQELENISIYTPTGGKKFLQKESLLTSEIMIHNIKKL